MFVYKICLPPSICTLGGGYSKDLYLSVYVHTTVKSSTVMITSSFYFVLRTTILAEFLASTFRVPWITH
jgi:hypothetical protein